MNYFMILYLFGWVMEITAAFLSLPMLVGLFYGESEWKAYAVVAVIALVVGLIFTGKKPRRTVFYAKDGFVTVAVCWITLSLVGALPMVISGEIPFYLDAVFEVTSGFTTTGATILTNVEALSHASLLWRSLTHWIGGMGVLVFLLAIIPLTGGHIMQLMRAESPGPSVGKFVPRIRQTAFILYSIYFILTLLELILLLAGGMPWFDSLTTALGTAGTGGFSIRNASMAFYQSNYLQTVVTVFMILFGVNFNIYYLLLLKKFKQVLKSEELRWYLGIIAFAVICITLNIRNTVYYAGSLYGSFHDAAFSVASVISTTGFCTADFDKWPQLSKFILLILMFIGASAGSTGGGMKVSRLILLVKSSLREIGSVVHPRGVNVVKLDKKRVDHESLKGTTSFFVISMIVFVLSTFVISCNGFDMTTSISAVAATMNNIGPGFGLVGPTGNFSIFSPLSKIVLIFDMLAGRLEFFPMLVLLAPSTWKESFSALKRRIIWMRKSMYQKMKR
ncbi:MAG: TrkH family potassium uptake protein [Ruminococcus sp.]|nr:TrkH family potassium uptake protein [Ruminococcus sp.]